MSNLGKFWAGRVYGTNTGNLFISFDEDGPHLSGTLRFLDDQFGPAVYKIEGTFSDSVKMQGTLTYAHEGMEAGSLTAEASLTPEGNLKGQWASSLGTGGLFIAYPHGSGQSDVQTKNNATPEQFYTQNINLGALNIFQDDILNLIAHVAIDFETGRAIVTYNDGGPDVTRFADDFLRNLPQTDKLKYLKVHIQEPDAHGINKLVSVEISSSGSNIVRVQGVRESWVVGKSNTLASTLKKNESYLVTTYKKFGLNLNQAIFVAMLVMMPEIESLQNRTIFVAAVFIMLSGFLWFHSKFIPNATINLREQNVSGLGRSWPTLISWLVAASASLVAALLFRWLVGDTP